jgi:hypothetical protein
LLVTVVLVSVRPGFGQSYTISTVAGAGWDLPGFSANLSNLKGLAVDSAVVNATAPQTVSATGLDLGLATGVVSF